MQSFISLYLECWGTFCRIYIIYSFYTFFLRIDVVKSSSKTFSLLDNHERSLYEISIHRLYTNHINQFTSIFDKDCLDSRKWVKVRKCESVISHFSIYLNTGKEKWENLFSSSLLHKSFPHFQGATVNFVIM